MDTLVKDILGLAVAFDIVAMIPIITYGVWATYAYDYPRVSEHIYRNYNYEVKGEEKVGTENTENTA